MAWLALGVFYGGVITGIPVVTGVAEGVQHQKEANKEAANETRMVKFYLDVFCEDGNSSSTKQVHNAMIVLKHDKVWIAPKDETTLLPLPLKDGNVPHPFTGFYIMYPDDERSPPERGLVSTISDDPPMLNWIYVDRDTLELKYGNRTTSISHLIGPWDWTEDEVGVTMDGWEGFVAVKEQRQEDGLEWALYYDRFDDNLGNGQRIGHKPRLQCSIERRPLPEALRQAQEEAAEKKMRVKTTGDLKTQWDAPSK